MKKHLSLLLVLAVFVLQSCQKDKSLFTNSPTTVPAEILQQIKAHGFATTYLVPVDDGYIVEGDILLTKDFLSSKPEGKTLRMANTEQYRTTELVRGLPRQITILVSGLGTSYVQGTDLAISRFNALGLQITFKRITSGTAGITVEGFNQGPVQGFVTLGNSGFPKDGNPYKSIKLNTNRWAFGTAPNATYIGSVIQHEMGHCIGFRHTDFMDRSYSCGGSVVNEGASPNGAIVIPGTPETPDANSWMLACANGVDRTFNLNDLAALEYLYK